jgi:hypothetical protein
MNTIIKGLKAQFGDDVVVDSTNKDFVRLSYTGPNVKAWEASAESCTGCGQNCYFLNGVLTVLTTDVQEFLNDRFFGKLREFGFAELAERVFKMAGVSTTFESTPAELAALAIAGGMMAVPDFVPEYDHETAKVVLTQVLNEPTEEQVAEFMKTNQLLKQYVEADSALKSAKFDLQCAIDNGNEEWEHGCRNDIFKQEYVMSKTLVELHA